MANKIQLKRGLKSKLPTLSQGEPAYTTDTREFFMGTGSGNVNMGGSQWYTGTDMAGTSATTTYSYGSCPQVKVGDMYLNTSNGNAYQCTTAGSGTSARWTYKSSIKGPQGDAATVQVSSWLDQRDTNPIQNKTVAIRMDRDHADMLELVCMLLSSAGSTVKTAVKNFVKAKYGYEYRSGIYNSEYGIEEYGDNNFFPDDYIIYLPYEGRNGESPTAYDTVKGYDGTDWETVDVDGRSHAVYGDALLRMSPPVNGYGKAYILYQW